MNTHTILSSTFNRYTFILFTSHSVMYQRDFVSLFTLSCVRPSLLSFILKFYSFWHCPPLLFPMVHPKQSPSGPVLGFWPKPPPQPSHFQLDSHTTTTLQQQQSHHPSTSSPTAISHGVPKTEPRQPGFAFFDPNPPSKIFKYIYILFFLLLC